MNQHDLLDLVNQYRTIRKLSTGAAYLMKRTVVLFGCYLGRAAKLTDLDDYSVSAWLEHLESVAAAWTRCGHRTRILSLWRFAARRKLCEHPGEVRREPAPEPMPSSWSQDDVRRLLLACGTLNTKAAAYFKALILAAYETGLRRSDLRGLRREWIGLDGVIQIRQHKTGVPHVVRVRPETAAAILALPGDCPLRCPWSSGRYGEYWFRICCAADVRHGGCQQLRRTGATWIAKEYGVDAARDWLGHRTAEMVAHYVDRSVASPQPRLPPEVKIQSLPDL